MWLKDLSSLRNRIREMRVSLNSNLIELGCNKDFSFIVDQNGMFSFSGISTEDVQKLRNEYSIYIVDSGRVNIAGITSKNINYISESINKVV